MTKSVVTAHIIGVKKDNKKLVLPQNGVLRLLNPVSTKDFSKNIY